VPLDAKFAAELVDSGLDAIYVSLDGATKESYAKYRIGGDYALVLKNVQLLSKTKKAVGCKSPRLIWKFVVFPHNQHEIEVVRKRHKDLGFDDFEFVEDHGSEQARQRRQNFNRRLTEKKSGCFFLWNTMVITSQGAVRPCCRNSSEFGLGNVLRDGVKEAWRSDPYNRLRLGFATESFGNTMHCVCKSCIGLAPQHSTETLVTISSKNAPKTEACFRQ
jgi:radical SAM protein with 4Fe4S-binding SPASM domain